MKIAVVGIGYIGLSKHCSVCAEIQFLCCVDSNEYAVGRNSRRVRQTLLA